MNFSIEKKYLSLLGVKIKSESSSNINLRCPVCGDSKKNKHKARGFVLKSSNSDTASYYCHNECGSMSFYDFLYSQNPSYAKQYLKDYSKTKIRNFKLSTSTETESKEIVSKKTTKVEVPKAIDYYDTPVIVTELNDECMKYLKRRNIDEKDWKYFRSIKNHDLLMILMFEDEKVIGYQLRELYDKKFFIHMFGENHKIWGIDRIESKQSIYIFEGVFDALSVNLPSVASLGSDLNFEIGKKQIYCFDNDETGFKKAYKYSQKGYDVLVHDEKFPFGDMNEALQNGISKEKLTSYVKANISSPLKAQLKLRSKGFV